MIDVQHLTKRYGSFTAVDDISFAARPGEVLGFLGPNGAGKTTTMRILTGYMPPTSGQAKVAGWDVFEDSIEARRHTGYLPETVPLYPDMTARGYLDFVADLRRLPHRREKVRAALERVGLEERADSLIRNLSKGMRQRLGLAQAIIHSPDVLILDEPTIGLDPHQVIEVRQLVRELGRHHTVMFSTHILSEAEQVCDRVLIMYGGRIVETCRANALHEARHPYTRALLNSLPRLDQPAHRLEVMRRDLLLAKESGADMIGLELTSFGSPLQTAAAGASASAKLPPYRGGA
jgi:ABC-2 type transport system ATP-binding protein